MTYLVPACALVSLVHAGFLPQTISFLLDENTASPATAENGLDLFRSLGRAVAIGAEAGEDIEEVSAGSIELRVTAGSAEPRVLSEAVSACLRWFWSTMSTFY